MRKLPNGDAFFENKYQPTSEEELAEYNGKKLQMQKYEININIRMNG
jgi:hypothetical protein